MQLPGKLEVRVRQVVAKARREERSLWVQVREMTLAKSRGSRESGQAMIRTTWKERERRPERLMRGGIDAPIT